VIPPEATGLLRRDSMSPENADLARFALFSPDPL